MHQRSRKSLLAAVAASVTIVLPFVLHAKPLVDCSKPEFKRANTARSLYLWTSEAEERIRKAKAQGVYEVEGTPRGDATPKGYCAKIISYRGTAHCKEPDNPDYRKALASILELCREAAAPPLPPEGGGPVDCKDSRFQQPGVPVDKLLRWVDLGLADVDRLAKHERFRLKPKCDSALNYAGAAYCKAPGNPQTKAAVARAREACAAAQAKYAAEEQAEAAAAAKPAAPRKIVAFPRSTYRGPGAATLAGAMKRALLAGRVAKSAAEILRVEPMGRWQSGRYTDTKVQYKKVMGTVLWHDKDGDGVCRFVSYKFIQDRARGGGWSPVRFKAFCNGCPEGWTRCR